MVIEKKKKKKSKAILISSLSIIPAFEIFKNTTLELQ